MTYLKSLRATGRLPFSIVQIIPGTVIGPSEFSVRATEAAARMDRISRALLFDDPKPLYAFGFVHVDDCAAVHVEALDEDKVPDSELPDWYIAAASNPPGTNASRIWREVGDVLERAFKHEIKSGLVTIGRDNVPTNMPYRVDSTLTANLLLGGRKFRGLAECVTEVGLWYKMLVTQEGPN
jgi:nucleoside-diphosphate-sugar epimerase